jgi:hypothetical protein
MRKAVGSGQWAVKGKGLQVKARFLSSPVRDGLKIAQPLMAGKQRVRND